MGQLTRANRNGIHPQELKPIFPQGPPETRPAFPIVKMPSDWWVGMLESAPLPAIQERNDFLPVCLWCDNPFNQTMQIFTGSDHGKLLMLGYVDQETANIMLEEHLNRTHNIKLKIDEEYDYTEPYGIICQRNGDKR
jgi:hypothetical protein